MFKDHAKGLWFLSDSKKHVSVQNTPWSGVLFENSTTSGGTGESQGTRYFPNSSDVDILSRAGIKNLVLSYLARTKSFLKSSTKSSALKNTRIVVLLEPF